MGMREKLIELLFRCTQKNIKAELHGEKIEVIISQSKIADHLIANGVTIPVRCEDCKHYDNSEGIQWCHLNSKFYKGGVDWHSFPEDGFCSYGERRTDD